jgi:hypothetical protein
MLAEQHALHQPMMARMIFRGPGRGTRRQCVPPAITVARPHLASVRSATPVTRPRSVSNLAAVK